MFAKPVRILSLSSQGLSAWIPGALRPEAEFEAHEMHEWKNYVAGHRAAVFTVVASLVEEDFRPETIPFQRGDTRAQLIARKLAQNYHGTPYSAVVSLGREAQGRRDESVLLMALTNAARIDPWLEVLMREGVQVRGLYSPALLTRALLRAVLPQTEQRALLVTPEADGLRQTSVEGGAVRFSRLAGQSEQSAEGADAAARARAALADITRTLQYVAGMRLGPRDVPPPVWIAVPPGEEAVWQGVFGQAPFAFELASLDQARRAVGMRAPSGAPVADDLWRHLSLNARADADFAPTPLKAVRQTARLSTAIWAAGAAACVLGLSVAAWNWLDAEELRANALTLRAQAATSDEQYAAINRQFPPLPVSPEQLKASVGVFETLARQTAFPDALFAEAGRALAQVPAFRLRQIDWQVSNSSAGVVAGAPGAAAAVNVDAQTPADAEARFEVLNLSGVLELPGETLTPRRAAVLAQEALDKLGRIAGVSVSTVTLPLSPDASGTVSGGDNERNRETPFAVRLVRKVGP